MADDKRRIRRVAGEISDLDREELRRESYALLKLLGWKPGDKFSMHSVSELMIAFAIRVKDK